MNKIGFAHHEMGTARHFVFLFKDSTFECLCDEIHVEWLAETQFTLMKRVLDQLSGACVANACEGPFVAHAEERTSGVLRWFKQTMERFR